MARVTWASAARILGWVVGVAFLVASIIQVALAFEFLGSPPEPPDDFVERTLGFFEYLQSQWPIAFTASALFAIGFVGLGLLGPIIGRLAREGDARRALVSGALLAMAGIGAASQLLQLGALPIVTSSQYCDCGLLPEEIMSRAMILDVVGGVTTWLVVGAIFIGAVGFLVAGRLGREAGMPAAWEMLSVALAVLGIALAFLAIFRLFPFDQLVQLVVAGILLPIWAFWLALRARDVFPEPATP